MKESKINTSRYDKQIDALFKAYERDEYSAECFRAEFDRLIRNRNAYVKKQLKARGRK